MDLTKNLEYGKFDLQVGPVHVSYTVPEAWLAELDATFGAWKVNTSFDESVIHRASVRIVAAPSIDASSLKVEIEELYAETSYWRWNTDPRHFSEAEWVDYRGVKADRRRHIDSALRNILANYVQFHGDAFMHASSVVVDGKAWVAPGQSGRGKTTFFHALGGYEGGHLHEDLCFITSGKVYSLPCRSSNTSWEMPNPKSVDLAGFIDLERSESVECEEVVSLADKLRVVGTASVAPLKRWDAADALRSLRNLEQLASSHRCLRLSFPREVSTKLLLAQLAN